jgi:hypothetical protein
VTRRKKARRLNDIRKTKRRRPVWAVMIGSVEQNDECILGMSMKLELPGAVECNSAGQLSTRRRKEME